MRTLEFVIGELWVNLRRNGLLTVAAVVTMTCSLATVGLVWLVDRNFQRLLADQAAQAMIAVHLKKGLSDEQMATVRAGIEALAGVLRADYVSPEAGWDRYKKEIGLDEALLEGESRLPPKFNVVPVDPQQTTVLAQQLAALPGVDDVRYGGEVVEKLNALVRLVRQTAAVALAMLTLATFAVISNAIRLTIYARRREIRIMQLVGAGDGFVRMPFLLEGLTHGIVGAGLAYVVVDLLYTRLRDVVAHSASFVRLLDLAELRPGFPIGLLALGALFGAASSLISMRQFLRED